MSIVSKNIFIVKCDINKFEESFSKKKNSEVINHYEIRHRLTNNDVFKNPPTNEIVQFQIVKRLNNFKECKKTEFLFFFREKIDQEFMAGIKEFFSESPIPVHFHLLTEKDIKDSKLKKQFNSVQYMDKSWS